MCLETHRNTQEYVGLLGSTRESKATDGNMDERLNANGKSKEVKHIESERDECICRHRFRHTQYIAIYIYVFK